MLASILLAFPAFSALSVALSINRRADSCGVRGYDTSIAYNYDGSGASATLSACGAKCKADPQCKSFGFGGSECLLYTTGTQNVNVDANSPYSFFDVGCYQICGASGYDLGTSAYSYDGSGANGNLAACSSLCLADFKCQGFAFSSTECLLYQVSASSNFYPLASSPYRFYDRSCVATPTTTSSSPTSSTSATPTPSQTFCLQVTGSGIPGKGYYAYTGPTSLGNPGLYFTSSATTTNPPQLFYISAPYGTPFLYDVTGNRRVEFAYRPSNPSPPPAQPLIFVGPLTRGDQQDYQLLNCAVGQNNALQCTSGAGSYFYNQWAVDDASFATEQRLYLQATTGGKNQIGLTVVDRSLCPAVAVANP